MGEEPRQQGAASAENRQLAQRTGAIAQKELNTSAIRLIGIANI